MNKITYAYIVIFILVLFAGLAADAYDDQKTHPKITENAAITSNVDSYLKINFGSQFSSGLITDLNSIKVVDWLTKGATAEDDGPWPYCRRSTWKLWGR